MEDIREILRRLETAALIHETVHLTNEESEALADYIYKLEIDNQRKRGVRNPFAPLRRDRNTVEQASLLELILALMGDGATHITLSKGA